MLPSLHRSTPILLLTLLHYYYYTTNKIPPLLTNSFLTLSFSTPTALLNKQNLTLSDQRHAYNYFPNKATVIWRETELFIHENAFGDRLLSRDLNALTRQTTNHR